MFFGIILGTYSSIYVASPIYYFLKQRFGHQEATVTKKGKKPGSEAAVV